jgi:hypothetical protein
MGDVTVTYPILLLSVQDMGKVDIVEPSGGNMTSRDANALATVWAKFPGAVAKIRHLFQHNPSFQSLCEDYRDCLAAHQYWRQASDTSDEAKAVWESYVELLGELEEELRQYLEPATA